MMAIIKQTPSGEIVGWMLGTDTHDLRRRAKDAFDGNLAQKLYAMEFPPPGKTELMAGYTLLVE